MTLRVSLRVAVVTAVCCAVMVGGWAAMADAQLHLCGSIGVTVDLGAGELPTDQDDVILGTAEADVIAAGDGNDVICGLGGDDVIWGQAGDDTIYGGDGDDRLRGGDGDDFIAGEDGANDLSGGRGDDIVVGGVGDGQKLRGGTGDDRVLGGLGADLLVAGNGGSDEVFGRQGDDVLVTGGPRPDRVSGGPGDDLVKGNKGADVLYGDDGDDDIRGGPQPDTIDGGAGVDTCNGGTELATAVACETEINIEGDVVDLFQGSKLDVVKDRGVLNCGVSGSTPGLSQMQPDGRIVGLDADMCRAIATAILGDSTRVNLVTLSAAERGTAIASGTVDVMFHGVAHTQSRDADWRVDFGPPVLHSGVMLMARFNDGFDGSSQVADVDGAIVCTQAGTFTSRVVADAIRDAGVSVTIQEFLTFDAVVANFASGACDVMANDDVSLLAAAAAAESGGGWAIFPRRPLTLDPLSPVYGENDSAFADVVNWTVFAMHVADEYGITSANVAGFGPFDLPTEADRLLGYEGELQTSMGLEPDAFRRVIAQVGSYDEVFDRSFNVLRSATINAAWRDGGLFYPPPMR